MIFNLEGEQILFNKETFSSLLCRVRLNHYALVNDAINYELWCWTFPPFSFKTELEVWLRVISPFRCVSLTDRRHLLISFTKKRVFTAFKLSHFDYGNFWISAFDLDLGGRRFLARHAGSRGLCECVCVYAYVLCVGSAMIYWWFGLWVSRPRSCHLSISLSRLLFLLDSLFLLSSAFRVW